MGATHTAQTQLPARPATSCLQGTHAPSLACLQPQQLTMSQQSPACGRTRTSAQAWICTVPAASRRTVAVKHWYTHVGNENTYSLNPGPQTHGKKVKQSSRVTAQSACTVTTATTTHCKFRSSAASQRTQTHGWPVYTPHSAWSDLATAGQAVSGIKPVRRAGRRHLPRRSGWWHIVGRGGWRHLLIPGCRWQVKRRFWRHVKWCGGVWQSRLLVIGG